VQGRRGPATVRGIHLTGYHCQALNETTVEWQDGKVWGEREPEPGDLPVLPRSLPTRIGRWFLCFLKNPG